MQRAKPKAGSRRRRSTPNQAAAIAAVHAPAVPSPEYVEHVDDAIDRMRALATGDHELEELIHTVDALATTDVYADHTSTTYGTYWRRFTRFAEPKGLPIMPSEPAVVLLFLAMLRKEGCKISTLTVARSAIASRHTAAGWESPTSHPSVQHYFDALKRRQAGIEREIKAHPLSVDDLLTMLDILPRVRFRPLNTAELIRAELKSVLLTTWHLGRRLDEVVRAELDWLERASSGGVSFTSDRQKNIREGFGNLMYRTTDPRLCPVRALDDWLAMAEPYRTDAMTLVYPQVKNNRGHIVMQDPATEVAQRHLRNGRSVGDNRFRSDADYAAYARARGVDAAVTAMRARLLRWMKLASIAPVRADRRLSAHGSRRGLVTELRKAGVDIRDVADHVGFTKLEMVEHYSDFKPRSNALRALDL